MIFSNLIQILKKILPPIIVDGVRFLKNKASQKSHQWEYMPHGWQAALKDQKIKGWNVPGVVKAYKSKWAWFVKEAKGTAPFDFTPESVSQAHCGDLKAHNTIMSYAYAFSMAAYGQSSISILDWGGGFGHYYLISRVLMPNIKIDYYCKDFPLLVKDGHELLPEIHFYTDEKCLSRQYDFILANSSLQYSQDWVSTLYQLAGVTARYIFIMRLPVIHQLPAYVVLQRPYNHQYDTEYLGWCFNHNNLIELAKSAGLELVREFFFGSHPLIFNAPEQPESRGFLFRKVHR